MSRPVKSEAMDYLSPLKIGHQAGQRELKLLSRVADTIEESSDHEQIIANLEEVMQFFNKELYIHFRQEEIALFPALISVIGREGVVSAMLGEHQSIWKAIDLLSEQIDDFKTATGKNKNTIQSIKMLSRHIVGLLGAHIEKEDTMLLPLSEEVLPPGVLQAVGEQIESLEP
ncbi:MAG: hemerythrin domain-containing protein [Dehalococcoidia bacterium]|nr:hemerythrin domain-containing protein [Dehalococcoidia bacterium]